MAFKLELVVNYVLPFFAATQLYAQILVTNLIIFLYLKLYLYVKGGPKKLSFSKIDFALNTLCAYILLGIHTELG